MDTVIKPQATRAGIPWQILGGVIVSEVLFDTNFMDSIETYLLDDPSRAWHLQQLRPNPGPGLGNIHLESAKMVAQYFGEWYASCEDMQLPIPYGKHVDPRDSYMITAQLLAKRNFNIRTIAMFVRQLADFRFGSNGQPLIANHAMFSKWTMADAVAIWHGYRYGVPEVSHLGQGFKRIEDFQSRKLSVEEFIDQKVTKKDGTMSEIAAAKESARLSIPIFEHFFQL
jgi:hypothetical protein